MEESLRLEELQGRHHDSYDSVEEQELQQVNVSTAAQCALGIAAALVACTISSSSSEFFLSLV